MYFLGALAEQSDVDYSVVESRESRERSEWSVGVTPVGSINGSIY